MQALKFIRFFANIIFLVMGAAFMLIALIIVGISAWQFINRALTCAECNVLQELLGFVGFLIMAVAIFDVGQYLIEEQAFKRQHRTPADTRHSLTRIVVIIVIAVSLDALLNVLKASSSDMRLLIYPSVLFLAAVFLLIGLGIYQRFSSLAEK